MINSSNLIIITTTKPNSSISEKRINNIINNFSKYNIPIIINDYIKKNYSVSQISCEMIINNINLFKNINYEYALLIDNDFYPIDNFLEELNKTIELLPTNWRCLHLCPGYLWGRFFRNKSKIGHLNPEYPIYNMQYHESGRYFLNCNANYGGPLGGPISILVNKLEVQKILDDFIKFDTCNIPNDVILKNILNENDFICREPMLGYENEEGGTTF